MGDTRSLDSSSYSPWLRPGQIVNVQVVGFRAIPRPYVTDTDCNFAFACCPSKEP